MAGSNIFINPGSRNLIRKSPSDLDFGTPDSPIQIGEVIDVFLSGPESGIITYRHSKTSHSEINQVTNKAVPLFANIKIYPIRGELVVLLNLGNIYYIPLNLLNNPVSNQVPPKFNSTLGVQTIEDSKLRAGNKTFNPVKQQHYITKLYEGDVVFEGRFGQSIKFGSTVKENDTPLNDYSKSDLSENGDPITIIRNGNKTNSENITLDGASVYLCSTQKIKIDRGTGVFSGITGTWSTLNLNQKPDTIENGNDSINASQPDPAYTPDPDNLYSHAIDMNTVVFENNYSQLTPAGEITVAQSSTGFLEPGNLTISAAGLHDLKIEERSRDQVYDDKTGNVLESYSDSVGYPTIGVGHKITNSERSRFSQYLKGGNHMTEEEIQKLLLADLSSRINFLNNELRSPVTQNMFDSLISMLYNTGSGNPYFKRAIDATNRRLYSEAASIIRSGPVTARGIIVPNLVARRQRESTKYLV